MNSAGVDRCFPCGHAEKCRRQHRRWCCQEAQPRAELGGCSVPTAFRAAGGGRPPLALRKRLIRATFVESGNCAEPLAAGVAPAPSATGSGRRWPSPAWSPTEVARSKGGVSVVALVLYAMRCCGWAADSLEQATRSLRSHAVFDLGTKEPLFQVSPGAPARRRWARSGGARRDRQRTAHSKNIACGSREAVQWPA